MAIDSAHFRPPRDAIERGLDGLTVGGVVLFVQQCLRAGYAEQAVAVCEVARALGHEDPALHLSEAAARFASGDRQRAVAIVDAVLGATPGHLGALFHRAHMSIALGDRDAAKALLTSVIDSFPDYPGAQATLSALLMPGPGYREVLAAMHRTLRPRTYLEIGVEHGGTLALATTATIAVGVDPAELPLEHRLPSAARLYRLESDAFFASETRASVFGGETVDFAFIDGMHWFEYALRDFDNAERWASRDGIVVLHDCLPATRAAAARERASTFWVGDVWKVLECLLEYRPELRIRIVPAPPSGLVVVRGLDPSSTLIRDRMEEIVERYRDATYPYAPGRWPAKYRLVKNDEAGLAEALGS